MNFKTGITTVLILVSVLIPVYQEITPFLRNETIIVSEVTEETVFYKAYVNVTYTPIIFHMYSSSYNPATWVRMGNLSETCLDVISIDSDGAGHELNQVTNGSDVPVMEGLDNYGFMVVWNGQMGLPYTHYSQFNFWRWWVPWIYDGVKVFTQDSLELVQVVVALEQIGWDDWVSIPAQSWFTFRTQEGLFTHHSSEVTGMLGNHWHGYPPWDYYADTTYTPIIGVEVMGYNPYVI